MTQGKPVTRRVELSQVTNQFSPLAAGVSRNEMRVIVEDAGAPILALVSVEDFERLTRMDAEREARFAVIDRMRQAFADVPTDEIEREVAKAVSDVRSEMAAERAEHAKAS